MPSLSHRHGEVDPPTGAALLPLRVLLAPGARQYRLLESEWRAGVGGGLGRLSVHLVSLVVLVQLLSRAARRVHLIGRVQCREVDLE